MSSREPNPYAPPTSAEPDREARASTQPAGPTREDLEDMLTHIDEERFPERTAELSAEYARRFGPTVEGVPVDAWFRERRRVRPFAEAGAAGDGCLRLLGKLVLALFVAGLISTPLGKACALLLR